MPLKSKRTALKIAGILRDKKAQDVTVLDIHSLTIIADYFIIASGRSESQVKALYEEVEEKMKEEGMEPRHRDGQRGNRWLFGLWGYHTPCIPPGRKGVLWFGTTLG